MAPRVPPRPAGMSRLDLPDARRDPRAEPVTVPPQKPAQQVSFTPIGIQKVSLSAVDLELEHQQSAISGIRRSLSRLRRRVRRLESARSSYVTISAYPKVAKQHTDTSGMDKLLERRKLWAAVGRGVVQGLVLTAIVGLAGLVWSYVVSPKPQNAPMHGEE